MASPDRDFDHVRLDHAEHDDAFSVQKRRLDKLQLVHMHDRDDIGDTLTHTDAITTLDSKSADSHDDY